MITLEKLLNNANVNYIIEEALALGFNEPLLYKAIYPDPSDYLYLLVESDATIINQRYCHLNEHMRVRYLEILLEKALDCTVIVRTKSTLAQNLPTSAFNILQNTTKHVNEEAISIINYYGAKTVFNKNNNTQISEAELSDYVVFQDIQNTKNEIKKIKSQHSAEGLTLSSIRLI